MDAYHRQLWNKVLPTLQAAPEDSRALNINLEASTLAKQQRIAVRHSADAASKAMATAVALRHHAWLRSDGITDDTRSRIEDLPFDGAGLLSEKTNEVMDNLHKIRKMAKSYSTQPYRYQCPQWS